MVSSSEDEVVQVKRKQKDRICSSLNSENDELDYFECEGNSDKLLEKN